MKRIHYFILLCLFFLGISSLNAQVTIGKNESPKDFSLLELNTTDSKLGLRLPQLTTLQRDALTQTTDAQAAPALVKGLMIYNLDTGCVDYWNGSQWIANCDNSSKGDCLAPCDCDGDGFLSADCGGTDPDDNNPCNPAVSGIAASPTSATAEIAVPVEFTLTGTGAAINNLSVDGGKTFVQGNKISLAANKIGANEFTIMVNNCAAQTTTVTINASPCQPITGVNIDACNGWTQGGYMFTYQSLQLRALKEGEATPLEYKWYVDDVLMAKTTSNTWTYTTPPAGTHIVKVAAANACGITTSPEYSVRVVAATYGILTAVELNRLGDGKYKFAHVNLGAEFELNPCEMYGDLYQWGRPTDGHQRMIPRNASSTTQPDRFTTTLAMSNNPGHNKYILTEALPADWRQGAGNNSRWGDGTEKENQAKAANDPCPQGWKVPSQKQWGAIFRGEAIEGHPNTATANTWTHLGNTWGANRSTGFLVGGDLFLPAAGARSSLSGILEALGYLGVYWSTTTSDGYSARMIFNPTLITPRVDASRSSGYSIRCIADETVGEEKIDPSSLPTGIGSLSGKTCFDIAETGNKLAARKVEKTNFAIQTLDDKKINATSASDANYAIGDDAITYSGIKQYVFTPEGTVSNVRFAYIDATGKIVEKIEGGNSGNNIDTPVTATVTYNSNLNISGSILRGLTRANAKTVDIYAIYNDAADGKGEDKTLKLTASFQDEACCGAKTNASTWLPFMCHNLGADQRLDGLTPAAGIHGAKYRFGAKLPSLTMAEDQANSGNITGWSSKPVEDGTTANWSTNNNPCPSGWRLPSETECSQVANKTINPPISIGNLTENPSNYSSALKVGDALLLPFVGRRGYLNGELTARGSVGIFWSSSAGVVMDPSTSMGMFVASYGITDIRTSRRGGMGIRCVAQ